MADLYAKEGEEVTCENGHLFGHFVHDIPLHGVVKSADFVYTDGTPAAYGTVPPKCECGARAFRSAWLGGWQAHFENGWRGTAPDAKPSPWRDTDG